VYLGVPESIYAIEAIKLTEPIIFPLPDEDGKFAPKAAKQIVLKSSGEYEVAEIPNKFDLYVTLVTDGVVSPDGYFTEGGKKILYGDTIGVNNGYSQMFGVVENITVVK